MFVSFLAVVVLILSVINLARITIYMLGADLHDRQHHRAVRTRLTRKTKPPLISVIVPAHNEELVILRCLTSLINNAYRNSEIIVVDDGSTDSTHVLIRDFIQKNKIRNITYLRQENQGKAGAINTGIEIAHGELIMVLDADSHLDPSGLSEVATYFDDDAILLVAANVKIIPSKGLLGIIQRFEYIIAYRMKRAQSAFNIEYIVGGIGSTFRKSVIQKIGTYDTDTVTEDIDFTMKLLSHGNIQQCVRYAPTVIAYTESVLTFRQLITQRFRWKYGRFQTFLKNRPMFFSRNPKFDKRLTMLQLPLALYGEFTFLLEPLVLIFLGYIILHSGDIYTLITAYMVTSIYLALNVIAEDTETITSRLKFLAFTPFMYPLLFILSAVEYAALIKTLLNIRELLNGKSDNRWQHVSRAG